MIEAIGREARGINLERAAGWLARLALAVVSLPPFVLGWLAGFVVRVLVWMAAAVVAGYKAGRGGT